MPGTSYRGASSITLLDLDPQGDRSREFSSLTLERKLEAFSYSYIWENGFKMLELVFLAAARNF